MPPRSTPDPIPPSNSRPPPPPPPPRRPSASRRRSTHAPPVTIAVMGATGSGKSSFINLASGSSLRVGMGLESCTAEVKLADVFTLDETPVILIDTPGFDDTTMSDADILKMIAAFLTTMYEKGFKLSGAIYIHRISDKRFTGTAARNFNMFRELCGDEALENVVLVTNMWGEVSPEEGQDRENQLTSKFFKPVLDKRAQMIRHLNTAQSAHNIIRGIVKNRPVVLQIQRELVDEHKDISATAAGNAVSRELNEQMRRHQDELKGVEEEIEQVLKEKDEEARQELEEDRRRLQEQVEKIKKDKEGMAFKYVAEKERMEAKLKEMEQEAKKEMERAEAEYRRPPTNLSYRPQDMANASVADRPGLKREIAGPSSQDRLDNFGDNRSVTIPSAPTNSGSNNADRTNNRGKGPQPPSDSYTSLVRAQESCLQHLPAQKSASGIQFLVTVIDRAYERQSEASKERLRQMFPSVEEEVLDLVLEECGGELERSTKRLSEIASGS